MNRTFSRRQFLSTSVAAAAAAASFPVPRLSLGKIAVREPMTRVLGRTGWEVTTLGLGGQASIQRTPAGVDPLAIIVKALERGVNYIDTSNRYAGSQLRFGEAFRALHLVPGQPGYDERRRRSLLLASKTVIRYGKGAHPEVNCRTDGPAGSHAADDIKRSLSQMFGDGKGNYPPGAYLDLFFIHTLDHPIEVDAIYEGLDAPDPRAERIGALATLCDFRDGTNRTGLNPREEKLIRGIGISGHTSSPVLMDCLQRDEQNLIDALLVSVNANERRYQNHQFNAVPVAAAKDVGIIGMKVFANGAMYTMEPRWPQSPDDVVRTVGSPELPSRDLVEYTLCTPGVATAVIGIGHIDSDPGRCQIDQNLSGAQIRPTALSAGDREAIERRAGEAKGGLTNWFQDAYQPLGAPREPAVDLVVRRDQRIARLTWHTAYAAEHPLSRYEIRRNGRAVGTVEHRPQTTRAPFTFEDTVPGEAIPQYAIVTIDAAGQTASTDPIAPRLR